MVEIQVSHLEKSFDGPNPSHRVLRDLNVHIESGEVIVIRGDNGTGKTTFLNILVGIDQPTAGSVRFSGLEEGRLRIGYTQQDYTSSLLPCF